MWLSLNHQDERAVSLLSLLSEHDRETNVQEKQNIRRTLDEILANEPLHFVAVAARVRQLLEAEAVPQKPDALNPVWANVKDEPRRANNSGGKLP